MKTLLIDDALAEGVSRCLQLDDQEFRLDLLPELRSSHIILGVDRVVVPAMHLLNSSMLARKQVAP